MIYKIFRQFYENTRDLKEIHLGYEMKLIELFNKERNVKQKINLLDLCRPAEEAL